MSTGLQGGDALRLASKGRHSLCVGGWQVKLSDPLVAHESYLECFEVVHHGKALYKFPLLYLLYFSPCR